MSSGSSCPGQAARNHPSGVGGVLLSIYDMHQINYLTCVLQCRPNVLGGANRRFSGGRGAGPPGSVDRGRERIFNAAR